MLRIQDHQTGPAPVHDEIRADVSRCDYGSSRFSYLTSANGYRRRRFQAVAILLRTPRTGILSEEAIEQRLSAGLPVSVRRSLDQFQITQLMQHLRDPRL